MNEEQQVPKQPGSLAQARDLLLDAARIIRDHAEAGIPPGAGRAVGEDVLALLAADGVVRTVTAGLAENARRAGGLGSWGFKNLADFLSCAGGLTRTEGAHHALLASAPEGLEATTEAITVGSVTASKAARIIYWVTRCADKRDRVRYPEVRDLAEAAQDILLPLAETAGSTCKDIDLAGRTLFVRLHPHEHDKTERDLFAERTAVLHHDADRGGFFFSLSGPSADYDRLRTALEAFTAPPQRGDTRRADQRRYDAATELIEVALSHADELVHRGGEPAQVRLTMSIDTLRGLPGAPPAVSDNGVVYPLSQARLIAKNPRMRAIITDAVTGEVLNVGRSQRLCPPRLRNAVLARHTSCAWEHGCDRPIAWCEIDHKVAWWDGGATDLQNLQPLCRAHNLAKEHDRAARERRASRRPPTGADPPHAA